MTRKTEPLIKKKKNSSTRIFFTLTVCALLLQLSTYSSFFFPRLQGPWQIPVALLSDTSRNYKRREKKPNAKPTCMRAFFSFFFLLVKLLLQRARCFLSPIFIFFLELICKPFFMTLFFFLFSLLACFFFFSPVPFLLCFIFFFVLSLQT